MDFWGLLVTLKKKKKKSGTHFKQLHDGGIFWIVGIQSWLCGPLPDFFHVVKSRCSNISDSIKMTDKTETKSDKYKSNFG